MRSRLPFERKSTTTLDGVMIPVSPLPISCLPSARAADRLRSASWTDLQDSEVAIRFNTFNTDKRRVLS
jgi:hypothetical protein